jgi:(p)ppGpp synthase/HD superfamily hydrolase
VVARDSILYLHFVAPLYSSRLDDALAFAADAFRGKRRKGSDVPYLTHLLQVMVFVGENGGDEDQMIAAVLHDYLEDITGASRELLATRFGERVATMVEALSDSTSSAKPKPAWEARKQAYLARLRDEPADVKLISVADKLHNARSIRRDLRVIGPEVWKRFTGTPEQTLWYYREVVAALGTGWTHVLLDDLRAEVVGLAADMSP